MPTAEEMAAVIVLHQPWNRSLLECTCGQDFAEWEDWASHLAQELRHLG